MIIESQNVKMKKPTAVTTEFQRLIDRVKQSLITSELVRVIARFMLFFSNDVMSSGIWRSPTTQEKFNWKLVQEMNGENFLQIAREPDKNPTFQQVKEVCVFTQVVIYI